MRVPTMVLPAPSALESVNRRQKDGAGCFCACSLLLLWMLLLLASLGAELAVAYAFGSAVSMYFIDSAAHKYDSPRPDH
jgi:ABC-type tungstate transport system substrate-binding protein